jgi:ribonuclease VapC
MVIDTSAIVALIAAEPEGGALTAALAQDERRLVSAVSILEAAIVLESRRPTTGRAALDRLVAALALEVVPFDADQLALARDGFRRYGRGRQSKARLNFGDCCSYALAKAYDEPLLYVGDDFGHTDIVPAV